MAIKLNIAEVPISSAQLVQNLPYNFFHSQLLFYDRGQCKNNFDAFLRTKVSTFKICGYMANLSGFFLIVTG